MQLNIFNCIMFLGHSELVVCFIQTNLNPLSNITVAHNSSKQSITSAVLHLQIVHYYHNSKCPSTILCCFCVTESDGRAKYKREHPAVCARR